MGCGRVIGRSGRLPWRHFSADMMHFRRVTMGHPIVMGRKTFESIGRALPGRSNIVVTRSPGFTAEGCTVALGLEAALAACRDVDEVMIVGGATLYEATIEDAQRMYLTLIHHQFEGDTFFPHYDAAEWKEIDREDRDADAGAPYRHSFVTLERA